MAVYSVFLPAALCFMLPLGAIFLLDGSIALNQFVLCCLMGVGVGFPMLRLVEFIPMLPQLSIKAEKLERIADYLDCSVDYLLGRTDNPAVNR